MKLKDAKKLNRDDEVEIKRTGDIARVYAVVKINPKVIWVSVVLPNGDDATLSHKQVR